MKIFNIEEILRRMRKIYAVEMNKDLAECLGVRQQTVSGWIARESIPLDVLLRVGNEKEISIDWLIYGQEQQQKLDRLEELVLSTFNALDDKAKIQMISLMNQGGQVNGITQHSGDNGINNVISGGGSFTVKR